MKQPHSYLAKAVRLLAPLLRPRGAEAARGRSRSAAKKADLTRAAPWFRTNNVVGVAVSRKASGSVPGPGELCLKFLVRRKLPKSRLTDDEVIPSLLRLEYLGIDVLTDVDVCPRVPCAQAASARVRPVTPGIGIGHPRALGGTLGLVVRKNGADHYLSCAHVLAPGGTGSASVGDAIEQPADLFGSVAANVVATLADFTSVRTEGIDAAIAQPNQVGHDRAVPGIGIPTAVLSLEATDFVDHATVLQRNGVGSGLQEGTVGGFGAFNLWFDDLGEQITLDSLVIYNAPNAGGDSGAAVFVKGAAVTVAGLHVGALSETQSLCMPIRRIFDRLGITL